MSQKGRGCNTEQLTSQRSAGLHNLIEERVEAARKGRNPYLIRRMLRVGDALLALTDAWRINYETLGYSEPALHTHIIPLYRSEPDDKRGRPAWVGYDWKTSRKFDPVADRPFVERMRRYLVG